MTDSPKITNKLLIKWNACTEGLDKFNELIPDGDFLDSAMKTLIDNDHDDYAHWLFSKCRDLNLYKTVIVLGYRNSGDRNSGHRNSGDRNSGHRNSGHLNSGHRNSGHLNSGDLNSGHRNSGHLNSGDLNSGDRNSGDLNSGYRNSGDRNSGDLNSGDRNSGHLNSGDLNSGYRNSGDRNSGDRNSGDRNSGYRNSGDRNSGYRNSGDRNSGDLNSGDRNSGDLNSGDRNSGYFNTKTPVTINVFDKPCDIALWDSVDKPDFIYFNVTEWVTESEMTDKEKTNNPEFYVAKGYLKTIDYKDAFIASWNRADPDDRIRIKELPNFDADTFYEISGIKVNED